MRLIESLATTEPLAELFSDESILRAMLTFETALARAEARVGVIPHAAAEAIESSAAAADFNMPELARDTFRAGTPGIPLVKALTERVRSMNEEAARFVHWGATSQDVADTALILLLRQAQHVLELDHTRLGNALAKMSREHRGTVMLGRTLLQAAPPITLGLKAAGWLAAVRRCWTRLSRAFSETLILQFGGASGTLAALGNKGTEISRALAEELGLAYPDAPWHTHRDRLANFVAACGVLTGSLAKMARDIALLMQSEVGEAAEAGGDGRGSSSTMPHKQNPIACSLTLAAAHQMPGLVASFLSAMIQEHERGVGGWQSEWPTVVAVVQGSGLALSSMAEAAEGLTIDESRMRANIASTRGNIFAERVMMLLGLTLGRDVAYGILEQASQKSMAEKRGLFEILAEMPEITAILSPETLREMDRPEDYLGSANEFRKRLTSPEED